MSLVVSRIWLISWFICCCLILNVSLNCLFCLMCRCNWCGFRCCWSICRVSWVLIEC